MRSSRGAPVQRFAVGVGRLRPNGGPGFSAIFFSENPRSLVVQVLGKLMPVGEFGRRRLDVGGSGIRFYDAMNIGMAIPIGTRYL